MMKSKRILPFLLPIRSVIFPAVFIIQAEIAGKNLGDMVCWWSVTDTVLNLLTIALLVFAARKNGMTYGELINYRRGQSSVRRVICVTMLVLVLGMGGMYLAGFVCYGVFPYLAPMMAAPLPAVLAILNIPLLPVTTAFAEDGLYLGCGVNNIKNKYAAVLLPAFFFALQHCFIPTLPDVRYMAYRFLSFLPLAAVLCLYYYKKRDPLPVMVGHTVIDIATVMTILATSVTPGLYEKMCGM